MALSTADGKLRGTARLRPAFGRPLAGSQAHLADINSHFCCPAAALSLATTRLAGGELQKGDRMLQLCGK